MDDMVNEPDPVVARRVRIAHHVGRARRIGYFALLVSMASFVVALVTDFPALWVNLSIGALVAACLILPVPIVLGYGVRAAEREDRERR
jgi:hypothetical protein